MISLAGFLRILAQEHTHTHNKHRKFIKEHMLMFWNAQNWFFFGTADFVLRLEEGLFIDSWKRRSWCPAGAMLLYHLRISVYHIIYYTTIPDLNIPMHHMIFEDPSTFMTEKIFTTKKNMYHNYFQYLSRSLCSLVGFHHIFQFPNISGWLGSHTEW